MLIIIEWSETGPIRVALIPSTPSCSGSRFTHTHNVLRQAQTTSMNPCEGQQATVLACSEPSLSSAMVAMMMPITNITSNCVVCFAPYTQTRTTTRAPAVQHLTCTNPERRLEVDLANRT